MNVVVSGSRQPTNLSQDAADCVFILLRLAKGFKRNPDIWHAVPGARVSSRTAAKIFETFPAEAKSKAMNSAEWFGAI
jgi:hypothetical protein